MYKDINRKSKNGLSKKETNCSKCFNSRRDTNTLKLICTKGIDITNTLITSKWCDYYNDTKPKYQQLEIFETHIDELTAQQNHNNKKTTKKWTKNSI